MIVRRPMSGALATQILQSIAAAAGVGLAIHVAACSSDTEGDGSVSSSTAGAGASGGGGHGGAGVTSSSITNSGGNWNPKEGVQCIPWPPRGGEGGTAGAASSTVAAVGGAGSCPPPELVTSEPDVSFPYLDADLFCEGYEGGCCSKYQTVQSAASQEGECCYEVVANCTSGSGRPLVVAGRPLTARVTREGVDAWSASVQPEVTELSMAQRQALASAWLSDALLEHASVASFSRFALELLAVGAPADLTDDAHRAARDEVRHARLCFALASAYAGQPLAPDAMPSLAGLAISADLADVAARAVIEGCVGETLAALSAAEQLEAATDPAVRAVLAEIAEDEARHAALAWRFVAWAVRDGRSEVRHAVAGAFAQAIADASAGSVTADACDPALAAHGRLGPAALRAVARTTMTTLIAPAMQALQLEAVELRAGAA